MMPPITSDWLYRFLDDIDMWDWMINRQQLNVKALRSVCEGRICPHPKGWSVAVGEVWAFRRLLLASTSQRDTELKREMAG